ncbi:MAG: hypothetical protein ACR2O4_08300 [Hyphomicrobiaceae bacterium]
MKKFVVTYYAPITASEQMAKASPEEMQEGMKSWMAWAQRCGDGLADMGSPLINGRTVTEAGAAPSDKKVTGYSILQAADMDAAIKMLDGHPHLGWTDGCEIGVHEVMPLPGM